MRSCAWSGSSPYGFLVLCEPSLEMFGMFGVCSDLAHDIFRLDSDLTYPTYRLPVG